MELSDSEAECAFESAVAANGAVTVRLLGEVDLSNVSNLRSGLEPLLDAKPNELVFDLADLTFVDSSGLAFLVETATRVSDLKVRNPSPLVRRIIEGTGLSHVLRIVA
jgi:anti-anti-sigma factor